MTIPDKAVEAALDAWIWTPKSTADIKTAMRAALAAAEQAMWEPIERAPRDGTKILAFARNPDYARDTYTAVAEWAPEQPAFDSVAGWFWPFAIRPQHWRPLPLPPETKK